MGNGYADYFDSPPEIERIADPELLAMRLVRNDNDTYWKRG
jgi:hypothetical protein